MVRIVIGPYCVVAE